VTVNCGALTSTLLGSELFGHVRGAFTGADRARDGLFVQAHRGTLFLDEVADMPLEMQIALLRVLEDRSVRPLGAAESRAVDVRVVAACSRDLDAEVAAGRFREDLFHRICVVRIDLPPLRARRDDIPLLAAHLAARTPEKAVLHPDAVTALLAHDWPGNVRELDNVIRACAVFAEDGEIGPQIIEAVVAQRRAARRPATVVPPPPAGPRLDALVHAATGRWRSAGELASRVGVSTRTVNRDLASLVDAGRIRATGEARARRYRSDSDPSLSRT
jgi:DNA-binding NtrC family response regulator